jgi:hypothetical protein
MLSPVVVGSLAAAMMALERATQMAAASGLVRAKAGAGASAAEAMKAAARTPLKRDMDG